MKLRYSRIVRVPIYPTSRYLIFKCRRHVLEMIQHCPQLFHGCHLKLPINIMMDYMYHLQHVRPSYISLKINYDYDADEIWKNQLIVRCSRLKLYAVCKPFSFIKISA